MGPDEVLAVAFKASVGILERVGTGQRVDDRVLQALSPEARAFFNGAPVPPVTIAASAPIARVETRDSRKLTDIDRELRTKLHVAANDAMRRTLERAGAKIVTKSRTAAASGLRPYVSQRRPPYTLPLITPQALLASLGLDEHVLLDTAFDDLRDQFSRWVQDAQRSAARVAARIVDADPVVAQRQLQRAQDIAREQAWNQLHLQLHGQASSLLDTDSDEVAADNLVPRDFIRTSLALAGGIAATSAGIGRNGPVDSSEVLGQIGTGGIVTTYLESNGASQDSYVWVHGVSDKPFPPHEELDGVTFATFDDPVLEVQGDFPDTGFYHPGDHSSCSCDAVTMWSVAPDTTGE